MTDWTLFWDMSSGGSTKEHPYEHIYIEAPKDEAKVIFYNRFGHNPERVSCTCCGEDYSISSGESLAQLSGYHRSCRALETPRDSETGRYLQPDDPEYRKHFYLEEGEKPPKGYEISEAPRFGKYETLAQYIERQDVFVIRESDIKANEHKGEVPKQGYVWHGDND